MVRAALAARTFVCSFMSGVAGSDLEADFSIEMGPGDAVLEVPWATLDGSLRYYDLGGHPELIEHLEEARRYPEVAEFLRRLNATGGAFGTVKCDAWASTEIEPAEEVFGASHKHGSYCDLVFRQPAERQSFARHEALARRLVELLRNAPEIPAAVEVVMRRCVFHEDDSEGCAITCFVTGYGNDEMQARRQWEIALHLLENALGQSGSESPATKKGAAGFADEC
jgi:hypothetical protein